jgi:hypothetical protein
VVSIGHMNSSVLLLSVNFNSLQNYYARINKIQWNIPEYYEYQYWTVRSLKNGVFFLKKSCGKMCNNDFIFGRTSVLEAKMFIVLIVLLFSSVDFPSQVCIQIFR